MFNYSGHGLMDLTGYNAYLTGKLTDYELPEEELQKYTKDLENLPKAELQKYIAGIKDHPKAEMRKTGKW